MGLFSKSNSEVNLNLQKEESLKALDLNKQKVATLCLNKPVLNQVSRVALALDFSGSMKNLYKNGTVQAIIEKMLPIAMQFDDNGQMEVWIFESGYHRLPDISLDNYYGYVEREIINRYYMGGTKYAPVMNDIFARYIKEEPANVPNYVIFITDGDNSDHGDTNTTIKELSKYPIFFQFVGVGNESFNYLQKLDDMKGRYVDNADFFKVKNAGDITYEQLLNEYPGWLETPEVRGML